VLQEICRLLHLLLGLHQNIVQRHGSHSAESPITSA
jgi:hypothetical protein